MSCRKCRRRSYSAANPIIKIPRGGDTILCHSTAVSVKTNPEDAVICIRVLDAAKVPITPPQQRTATNSVYAGNIDFGSLPDGADGYLEVCYAKNGDCALGTTSCASVPVKFECKIPTWAKALFKAQEKKPAK